jgi:hypothetical protein
LTLFFGLLSCNSQTEKTVDNSAQTETTDKRLKLHKLKKLIAVGDFDGDKKQDTIFQNNFSRLTKAEIEYSPDPLQNEWDKVAKWFYEQEADVYLTINAKGKDTLHLGIAQGLYCLINIGDNNADGKDEIALVVDYLDFSMLNTCKIYSLCKNKWTLLKQFEIHEGSFEFTTDKAPNFDNIKGFLEIQNDQWVYKGLSQVSDETREDSSDMKTLRLDKCR